MFFPLSISSGSVEGSFGNPAIRFFAKSPKHYCSQSENKKNDKLSYIS